MQSGRFREVVGPRLMPRFRDYLSQGIVGKGCHRHGLGNRTEVAAGENHASVFHLPRGQPKSGPKRFYGSGGIFGDLGILQLALTMSSNPWRFSTLTNLSYWPLLS